MTLDDLKEIYCLLAQSNSNVWVDGGWAVDLLMGHQTRPHDDLDIVVELCGLDDLKTLLHDNGFKLFPTPDMRPENFVLSDSHCRQVDFHVIEFDQEGNGIYGPAKNAQYYPADAFETEASIDGVKFRCLKPKFLLSCRDGYALRDKDHHDVRLLKKLITANR